MSNPSLEVLHPSCTATLVDPRHRPKLRLLRRGVQPPWNVMAGREQCCRLQLPSPSPPAALKWMASCTNHIGRQAEPGGSRGSGKLVCFRSRWPHQYDQVLSRPKLRQCWTATVNASLQCVAPRDHKAYDAQIGRDEVLERALQVLRAVYAKLVRSRWHRT